VLLRCACGATICNRSLKMFRCLFRDLGHVLGTCYSVAIYLHWYVLRSCRQPLAGTLPYWQQEVEIICPEIADYRGDRCLTGVCLQGAPRGIRSSIDASACLRLPGMLDVIPQICCMYSLTLSIAIAPYAYGSYSCSPLPIFHVPQYSGSLSFPRPPYALAPCGRPIANLPEVCNR